MYGELLGVYSRYVGHVTGIIGGVGEYNKKPEQDGNVYVTVSKAEQKRAMDWLQKNAFATQKWIMPNNILENISPSGYTERMSRIQNRHLNTLLNARTLQRMINAEVTQKEFYAPTDMVRDLRRGIFSEANATRNVDVFRRNLQKSFIERMRTLMGANNVQNSDLFSIIRGELTTLKSVLRTASSRPVNRITKYHYRDCIARIENILDPK